MKKRLLFTAMLCSLLGIGANAGQKAVVHTGSGMSDYSEVTFENAANTSETQTVKATYSFTVNGDNLDVSVTWGDNFVGSTFIGLVDAAYVVNLPCGEITLTKGTDGTYTGSAAKTSFTEGTSYSGQFKRMSSATNYGGDLLFPFEFTYTTSGGTTTESEYYIHYNTSGGDTWTGDQPMVLADGVYIYTISSTNTWYVTLSKGKSLAENGSPWSETNTDFVFYGADSSNKDTSKTVNDESITTYRNCWKLPAGEWEVRADFANSKVTFARIIYLVGAVNEWSFTDEAYRFTYEGNGRYTLSLDKIKAGQFKLGSLGWDAWQRGYGASNTSTDLTVAETEEAMTKLTCWWSSCGNFNLTKDYYNVKMICQININEDGGEGNTDFGVIGKEYTKLNEATGSQTAYVECQVESEDTKATSHTVTDTFTIQSYSDGTLHISQAYSVSEASEGHSIVGLVPRVKINGTFVSDQANATLSGYTQGQELTVELGFAHSNGEHYYDKFFYIFGQGLVTNFRVQTSGSSATSSTFSTNYTFVPTIDNFDVSGYTFKFGLDATEFTDQDAGGKIKYAEGTAQTGTITLTSLLDNHTYTFWEKSYFTVNGVERSTLTAESTLSYNTLEDTEKLKFSVELSNWQLEKNTISVDYKFVPSKEGADVTGYTFKFGLDATDFGGQIKYAEGTAQSGTLTMTGLTEGKTYTFYEKSYYTIDGVETQSTTFDKTYTQTTTGATIPTFQYGSYTFTPDTNNLGSNATLNYEVTMTNPDNVGITSLELGAVAAAEDAVTDKTYGTWDGDGGILLGSTTVTDFTIFDATTGKATIAIPLAGLIGYNVQQTLYMKMKVTLANGTTHNSDGTYAGTAIAYIELSKVEENVATDFTWDTTSSDSKIKNENGTYKYTESVGSDYEVTFKAKVVNTTNGEATNPDGTISYSTTANWVTVTTNADHSCTVKVTGTPSNNETTFKVTATYTPNSVQQQQSVVRKANALNATKSIEIEFTYDASLTGIDDILVDMENGAEYYNLSGMRISNPTPGSIVIRVSNGKATKVLVK